jgi:Flp pilus assembly protein TadD
MEQGSDDEAIPVLREAAQLNAAASTPRVLLGKLLVKKGETEPAARCFEEALKLDPNDHTAAYQLAVLYRKAGRMAEAQALMETVGKAVSAPDSGPSASRELVRILRDTSR